ncbi:MAG: hypothetical protein JSV85_02845 [Candidatus Bathyarchaeota archaeon]|nr:MAG: hypothetical protein JSV85_02845 [Candidatus Bathyarchaeota archaeon]
MKMRRYARVLYLGITLVVFGIVLIVISIYVNQNMDWRKLVSIGAGVFVTSWLEGILLIAIGLYIVAKYYQQKEE